MKALLTIDVAHPPLNDSETGRSLDAALKHVRESKHLRVLKIIHGFGALGTPAPQKSAVDVWLSRNRGKFISSINGEEISASNANIQVLLAECDIHASNDFLYPNGEITIVWVT